MKKYQALVVGLAALGLSACSSLPAGLGAGSGTSTAQPTRTASTAGAAATVSTTEAIGVVVNAFLVGNANGQETLTPITPNTSVKKGDLVEYHGLFTNTSKDRVRNMTLTLTLPQGATFTGVTEPKLGVQASVDGQQFSFMPLRSSANGQLQNVPFERYQALRFTVEEVGIGATAVVKYRATIN